MALKQTIRNASDKASDLIDYITNKFQGEGYEVQVMNFGKNGIIQVRNTSNSAGGWFKSVAGLGNVATLKVDTEGSDLIIEATGGKWLDKAAVMGVSMVILWPLFFTSGIGMITQNRLIKRLFDEALQFLSK